MSNTLTEKQLLETYGKYRLVAFMVDETDGFSDELQQYANGKIFNCYITTLEEFLTRYDPSCASAGYCMTQPYDYDDERDEDDEGSYRWMEDQLRDVWCEVGSHTFTDVSPEDNFFILDDYWQLDLSVAREVYADLQHGYEYLGYMKPSRKGKWYDNLSRSERKEEFIKHMIVMSVGDGDFTCNGAIHDDFVYDEDLGWRCVYRSAKEFIRDTFGNWMEVGD